VFFEEANLMNSPIAYADGETPFNQLLLKLVNDITE
jgi:hypothetical protein